MGDLHRQPVYGQLMLTLTEVLDALAVPLGRGEPFSLVRLGHGEIFTVAHRLWPDRFAPRLSFLEYAGITDRGPRAGEAVLGALRRADIVGLTMGDRPFEAPLTREILKHHGLRFKRICSAHITHEMIGAQRFWDLLAGRAILLVGRRAPWGAPAFEKRGVRVAKTMGLEGFGGIAPFLAAAPGLPNFDLALLSAGVPATIACPELARVTGRPAVDFGHALDYLLDGEAFDHERLVAEFNRRSTGRDSRPSTRPGSRVSTHREVHTP